MRITAFVGTTLPTVNLSCRLQHRSAGAHGGCGDYAISGHAVLDVLSICVVVSQRIRGTPRWPRWLVAAMVAMFGQ